MLKWANIFADAGHCAAKIGGVLGGSGWRWLVGWKVSQDALVRSLRKIGCGVIEVIGHQPRVQEVARGVHELGVSAHLDFGRAGMSRRTPPAQIGCLAGCGLFGLNVPSNHLPILALFSP